MVSSTKGSSDLGRGPLRDRLVIKLWESNKWPFYRKKSQKQENVLNIGKKIQIAKFAELTQKDDNLTIHG